MLLKTAWTFFFGFLLSEPFGNVLGRIIGNGSQSNADNNTQEFKHKIDILLQEKVQLYLHVFFNEEVDLNDLEAWKANTLSSQPAAIEYPRSERIRRTLTNSSNRRNEIAENGGYSNWSTFGPCSKSCGGGTQQRTRSCTEPISQNGGKSCSMLGPSTETKLCNIFPCMSKSYMLKRFRPISKVEIDGTIGIKHFEVGESLFIATLFRTYVQLFKWNGTTESFVRHGRKIQVFQAKSFDIFHSTMGIFLVLSEEYKLPYTNAVVSRVLTFNEASTHFEYKNNFFAPVKAATKVELFQMFGQMFAAFIFHENNATTGLEYKTTVCGGNTDIIKCGPSGSIRIESAFYGRKSWSLCTHGWYYTVQACSAERILEKMASLCNNKTECVIKSPPDDIKDPCPIYTKYLTIVHTCEEKLYKASPQFYMVKENHFEAISSENLETHGARDIVAFNIHNKHFLAVANYVNDAHTIHLNSEIFIYNAEDMRFDSFQKLRTDGAHDWEFFSIGEGLAAEYFLAVANNAKYDKAGKLNHEVDSVIYKWNWNIFVPFQCIRTTAAFKWTVIQGENGQFLLTLSSEDSNVAVFGYNGWRFYRYEIKPMHPAFLERSATAYSFTFQSRVLYVIANSSRSLSGVEENLFEAEFEKDNSEFSIITNALSTIHSVNQSLMNLSTALDSLSTSIVMLNGTNDMKGHKTFEEVIVIGDVRTTKIDIMQARLSQQDIDMVERQEVFKRRLERSGKEIYKLMKTSERLLSKTKSQIVYADYQFKGEVYIKRLNANNAIVPGMTVNGIDLSYIASNALYIDENNIVLGNKAFLRDIRIDNNLIVNGLIDGVNVSELVLLDSDQMIYGRKTFKGNILFDSRYQTMNLEFRGCINKVCVSRDKLLTVKDDQLVTGNYTFVKELKIEKNLRAKLINGVDLSEFYKKAVLLHVAQNITGLKQFKGNLKIEEDLKMADGTTINYIDVSELRKSILSRTKDQIISVTMKFQSNVTFQDDLRVDRLINGINISSDVVHLSHEQIIAGEKTFLKDLTTTKSMTVDGLLNGLNISGDLLTVSGEQVVSGHITFKNDLSINGNIELRNNKKIDDVDLSQLQYEAVFKDRFQVITGEKHFNDVAAHDVEIKCNTSCCLTELLKNLTEKTVRINQAARITGTKTFEKDLLISESLIVKGFLNGIKVPSDLIPKQSLLILRGKKIFKKLVKVTGKVDLTSTVNNFNISEWYEKALRIDRDQSVTGRLTFLNKLIVRNSLIVNGLVNGFRIPDDFVKIHGDELISAHKIVNGKIKINKLSVDEMIVSGLVDGVNVAKLNRTLFRTNGEQILSGNVTFYRGLEIAGSIKSNGEINGVNLAEIDRNAMKINGDQIITGRKIFSAPISVTNLLEVTGLVDGVNLTELEQNVVTLFGNQTIQEELIFLSDLIMKGDFEAHGLVNTINISKFAEEAFYKSGKQIVSGKFQFNDVHIVDNLELDGKLNGVDLSEDVVTLSGDEEVKGKLFEDDVEIYGNIFVRGLVNNINLTAFDEDCVKLYGLQTIYAKKVFLNDLTILGNMTVEGRVDGVDVIRFSKSILHRNNDQTVDCTLIFGSNVTFKQPSTIEGYMNDVNISDFSKNVVTLSTDQTIEGEKSFTTLDVSSDLTVDNLIVIGKLNGQNLSDLNDKIVRVYGSYKIYGIKTFAKSAIFAKDLAVTGKVNGLSIPQDIALLSMNESITGIKMFHDNIYIRGDLSVENGTKVDGVDVSSLARNAVYINTTQIIYNLVEFKNIELQGGILIEGLVNGIYIRTDNLLLRNREQTVTGKKIFKHVSLNGDLRLHGNINGIDLLEMNKSSIFIDRDNVITAEKVIIGHLYLKQNISISGNINGIRNFIQTFLLAKKFIDGKMNTLASAINQQEAAIAMYTDAISTLKTRLDYFIEHQRIDVDENAISFDVCDSDDGAILMSVGDGLSKSSVYKAQHVSNKFITFGEMPFSNASDVRLFESDGHIYAVVPSLQESSPTQDISDVYLVGANGTFSVTKAYSFSTWKAINADVSHYRNNTIVTFTNTRNESDNNRECVATSPLLFNSNGHQMHLVTIVGCNVVKVISKQINDYQILVVSINSGLYSETEAVVYMVEITGTYTVLQSISIDYTSDVMFLEARGSLFLVIANQYRMSRYSVVIEYKVPAQIYEYWEVERKFVWYQDLETKGAHLISSFAIDEYVYLVVSSKLEEIKIFQFFGSGKFRQVSFIRCKGMTNIRALRTWKIKEDVFVGVLSSDFKGINIFKAVKTSLLTGLQIKKMLDEA